MDMAPPQAPPALTRTTADDAAALIDRLGESHQWLSDQQQYLPLPPTDGDMSRQPLFMDELAAYWRAPVSSDGPNVARAAALALRLSAVMRDNASLLAADGFLSARANDAVHALTAAHGHILPSHLTARALRAGSATYAGALVLEDSQAGDLALLFTPGRGWEEFSHLDALHDEFEERMREALATTQQLPGLSDDDMEGLEASLEVSSDALTGNVMDALVRQMIDVQRRKVNDAWGVLDRSEGHASRKADRIQEAMSPDALLDVPSMLLSRQARLLTTASQWRLEKLPVMLRASWLDALTHYARDREDTQTILEASGFNDVESLDQFARRELAIRLQSLGVMEDPADINIEIYATTVVPSNGYTGTDVEILPIIELARQNFGFIDLRAIQAKTVNGRFLLQLRRDDVIGMIRDLDLRNRYQRYLSQRMKTSPEGQVARSAMSRLLQSRMRFELEDARAANYIAEETPAFLDDRAERGYHWVKSVTDAPKMSDRPRTDGHIVTARHILLNGMRMKDVLSIGAQNEESVPRIVLYTPDAPDHRHFREFADRQTATQQFFNHPDFADYLRARLPTQDEAIDTTQARFADEVITNDVFLSSYDTALAQLGLDAERLSRSTVVADLEKAQSFGVLALRTASGFAPMRVSLAVAGAQALWSVWEGARNVAHGTRIEAVEDFISAFASATSLMSQHSFKHAIGRVGLARLGRTRALVSTPSRLPDTERIFDARYLATGVRLKDARAAGPGILTVNDQFYIQHGGALYGAQFDRANGTWRLRKPQHAASDYGAPVIRDAHGYWSHNRSVGLLGGGRRPDLSDKDALEVLREYRSLSTETAGLSEASMQRLVRKLKSDGLLDATAKRLIYDRTHDLPTSATFARRWEAALDEVRFGSPDLTPSPPTSPESSSYKLVKLERSRWPSTVWHYTTPRRLDEFKGHPLSLRQSQPSAGGPAGVHVMTLDPTSPSRDIVTLMRGRRRTSSFSESRVDTMAGAYVEIDMTQLRNRQRFDGTYEFNLYTVTNRGPKEFVIRATQPAPTNAYAPLSPSRSRVRPDVVLNASEFKLGYRTMTPPQASP
ncbi:hypothetical protein FHW69_000906 [Luteibacter sp. Sphag1AF]|uniref:dermonecrotic toxin domain-containing protein n=1 Tax=Luteibacter sp. Sphag1AF TaxID=2587031 RepID=UPI001620117E|nr:DUF6543 domain-containing protein [Luteibacter sp. Sphag1AF]MBB3226316.1 hypothetical protein [Luteibacter sp. Sphag1AF]